MKYLDVQLVVTPEAAYACVSTPYKIVMSTTISSLRPSLNLLTAFAAELSAMNVMISSYVVKKQSDTIFIL
jgi:hypothetical protein